MKIIGLTLVTNPDYRQDPWRESIRQMLNFADLVVVICGRAEDVVQLKNEFNEKVEAHYMDWPQPEWDYSELPRHLNFGLEVCRQYKPDWIIKFDIDCFFHEKNRREFLRQLAAARAHNAILGQVEKLQFTLCDQAYEKGKMPMLLNLNCGIQLCFGWNRDKDTDLCQPIVPDGQFMKGQNPAGYEVPTGTSVPERRIFKIGGMHVWNYDYTFKTKDRAKELLYYFDKAHAKYFGFGYSKKKDADITAEQALDDFIKLQQSRRQQPQRTILSGDHPLEIRKKIIQIKPACYGFNCWGHYE